MNALVKIFFIVNFIYKVYSFCPVHLTISSNSSSLRDANIIASWDPKCNDLPALIRIYSENPYLKETPALDEFNPRSFKSGRVDTQIKLGNLQLPKEWDVKTDQENQQNVPIKDSSDGTCLNYYVLSFNKTNHVTNFNCLKINPQWMSNSRDIWMLPLKHLIIPGSKCSGCYKTERSARRRHQIDENFHQNMDVWHQLVFGVRYLDFSVGYFRSFHKSLDIRGRFWVFNENHEISPIFPILEDILKFVEISNEIVILDFRHFSYGFHESTGAHDIFKKLLLNMFGHIAVISNGKDDIKSYDFTIQKMKSMTKFVLILYNHDDLSLRMEQNETILWPAWNQNEIQTNENVVKFMSSELSTKYRADNSVGWILTANYTNGNTDYINSYILSSLTGPWNSKMNVISFDYVFSTCLVDISISINHQKALAKRNFIIIDL